MHSAHVRDQKVLDVETHVCGQKVLDIEKMKHLPQGEEMYSICANGRRVLDAQIAK